MTNNDIISGFDSEKDESLKIKLKEVPDVEKCLVFILSGYIDTYNSTYFQKMVNKAIEAGYIRLIFSCEDLNYVSSTGIGSFSSFLKTVKPKGGDIVLFDVQPKVYEVFQLLGFSRFFHFEGDLGGSIDFFRSGTPSESDPVFPKNIACPICAKELKVLKPSRFRCSECNNILIIDNAGKVLLG